MRVGILIHKCSGGGAERIAGAVSAMLDDQGQEVFFCTFFKEDEEYPYAGSRMVLPAGRPGALASLIRRIQWVKKIKEEKNLDVMISFLPQANLINLITGGRAIVSFRNNPNAIPSIYRTAFRHTLYRADKVVAISKGVGQALKEEYNGIDTKVHVIYNPLNNFTAETRGLRPVKRILSVGRLTEQKAHHITIEAFAKVAKVWPDLTLKIVGNGPLKDQLIKQAKKTGFGDRIQILPFTKNIEEEYRQADLFVLASKYEGFGNVILEAMAKGCPVIATDCDYGPREIIAPATPFDKKILLSAIYPYGFLVPIQQIDEETVIQLAAAMGRVIDDDTLRARLNAAGPKRTKDFSGEEIGLVWRRLLNP